MTFLREARERKDLFLSFHAYWIRKLECACSSASDKQFIIHDRNKAITRNFLNCYLTLIRVNHVWLSLCPPERCFIIAHYCLSYVTVESQKCPLWLIIRTHQSRNGLSIKLRQRTKHFGARKITFHQIKQFTN